MTRLLCLIVSLFLINASTSVKFRRVTRRRSLVAAPDGDLYGCSRHFSCGSYTVHFASAEQAKADPESHYSSLATGPVACQAPFETVLLLGNVKNCQKDIQSVKFALTYPSGIKRLWTEAKYPYAVFKDDGRGAFESRLLESGPYKLKVDIYDVNSCLLARQTYDFNVSDTETCANQILASE